MGVSKGMSRLKLAEQLITQRRRVTESTINEYEHVEINKLRTELNAEYDLAALGQAESAARNKQYLEDRDTGLKRDDEFREFDRELAVEMEVLKTKFNDKKVKASLKYSALHQKSNDAYDKAASALNETREKVDAKLHERSLEVQEKAAQMRTQLSHDCQAAIDKLYQEELGSELQKALDSIPSIQMLDGNSPRLSYKKE